MRMSSNLHENSKKLWPGKVCQRQVSLMFAILARAVNTEGTRFFAYVNATLALVCCMNTYWIID
jgi:hypothetical protein